MDSIKLFPLIATFGRMNIFACLLMSQFVIPVYAEDNTSNLIPVYQLLLLNEENSIVPPSNNPPVANAGADQTVLVGTLVLINGSASNDPDGDTLTYSWGGYKPAGSAATLSSLTGESIYLIPDIAGTYEIQLIVNDGKANSAPDTVIITAIADSGVNEYYVTVSREDSNIYDVISQDIFIFTKFCYEFVYYDNAILYGDETIKFSNGNTCSVDGVYENSYLSNGSYSVTVTREKQDWYSVLGYNGYIKTAYCYEYQYYDNATLSIDTLGTGTLTFSNKSTCDVAGYYTKMDL